jgi:hypothetical protein
MRGQIDDGYEGAKLAFTRITFSYYMSEAAVQYVLDAVHLLADHGRSLLELYRFDPQTGLWRHRDLSTHAPAGPGLRGALATPRPPAPPLTAPESALAGQLKQAREMLAALAKHPPAPSGNDPVLSDAFEQIRWFPLPGEDVAERVDGHPHPRRKTWSSRLATASPA